MAYRIDYSADGKRYRKIRRPLPPSAYKTIFMVAALIIGAVMIKIYGLNWVREILLPGDPDVTAAALENMTEGLKNGDSLLEAVTAFCREIVANAQ